MIEFFAPVAEGMVIQRGARFPVRGKYLPSTGLTLSFLSKTYRTQTDPDGVWYILLESAASGGPFVLEAVGSDGADTARLEDVYVGDVWLCAGQSNMELPITRLKDDFPEELTAPSFPCIRQYMLPYTWDFSGPRTAAPKVPWVQADAQSLLNFSGTAWFFAKKIAEKQGVPVGLMVAAVGGAPAEAFMSREALAEFPRTVALGEQYADSGLREEILTKAAADICEWERCVRNNDKGLAESWASSAMDDSDWREIGLPGDFARTNGLEGFCGALWLRRRFIVPQGCGGKEAGLWLGTIVDSDQAYINGVEIGSTGYRYPPRKYAIPAGLLREGENQITIRVVSGGGDGGITTDKPFRLFSIWGAVELAGQWKYKIGMRTVTRPKDFFFHWQPMGLFNGMIAPLLEYPFAGVIWYQGESNDKNSADYAALFVSLIKDWRVWAKNPALPFLFVQLPLFGKPGENTETSTWAQVREAQQEALALPATGMATGLDLGEWNDLHPVNKKGVGERLALAAEKTAYHGTNTSPGPTLRSLWRRKDTLILEFDNCGAGLTARNETGLVSPEYPVFVSVISETGMPTRLLARIETPNRLVVDLGGFPGSKKILYAWADNPADRQLYNSEGLPASPFRREIPGGTIEPDGRAVKQIDL
ncbi:MAG: hypothetical protein LBS97_02750 [Treponema sp.]|jgi:sialate O-acetylesterase|nr:hypothetical protein [Treponema sp.]